MTTTTFTTPRVNPAKAPGALQRILNVARLHLVNKSAMIGMPWLIMGIIFLASLLVWWLIATARASVGSSGSGDGDMYVSGASSFVIIYMLVVAVQAINLTFPFAQGYSVTRRDFYLGSALAFVGIAVGYSVALTLLGLIERATNGWGLGGIMFDLGAQAKLNLIETFYVTLVAFLFFFFIGAAVASMYVRWRMYGIIGFFAGMVLLGVAGVAFATLTESWPLVGEWFATNGVTGVATWMLVPASLAAVTGFFILRRATPRN